MHDGARQTILSAEQISAFTLERLVKQAEEGLEEDVDGAVSSLGLLC